MKDKHINNRTDTDLLRLIQKEANAFLKKTGPIRHKLWLKFLFYFLPIVGIYQMIMVTDRAFLLILYFILYGFFALMLAFNFAHDFSHNTVFKNSRVNSLFFTVIYAINGAHAEAWKYRHIHSHHFAPNVEDYDSDLKITRLIRVTPGSELLWYHRFQHLYAPVLYTTYSLFWVFIKDFVILFEKDEAGEKKKSSYYLSFMIQKVFYITYILVLPLIFCDLPWYIVITGFLLMHIFQSVFLLFTFFMTHHVESTSYPTTDKDGFINSSWLMNQVKSSNDMYPFSRLANFIFGGFNNHIAHHLFPNVHHIHYPKLNVILYRVLGEKKIIPNQTSYFGGIASHLRLLKKMGRA